MKNKGKKLISLLLVAVIVVSVAITGVVSFGAYDAAPPNPNRLPEYTPSTGVETSNINFAMPGSWTGAEGSAARQTWEKYGSTAGIYWWGSLENPDEAPAAAGHGWPGWKMKKSNEVANLYTSLVPKGTASMIFSNFIDGGLDTAYPEFNASQHTMDLTMLEYIGEGDSDYYPKEFWDYVYDNYYEDMADDPDYQVWEFGDYAKNFFYSEDDDCIFHRIDDMVFVVDYDESNMHISPVSGKAGFDGAFYFYYGNGEFGIWPTKEMCIEKEGLKVDEQGDVFIAEETVDEKTDFVIRKHTDAYDGTTNRDFVVYGNITGKYWAEVTPPPEPVTQPATSISPGDPGGSSSSDGSGYTYPEPSTIDITLPSGSGNKVYFYADPSLWKYFKNITMYIYEHGGDTLITWGSKKGNMTNEGNNIWSFDFDQKGISLDPGKQYGIIFTADWNQQTCDIIFDTSCLGDIAFCPGDQVENNIDSNKKSLWVWWKNADPSKCAPPLCVTSIGNLIGYALWYGQTKYSVLVDFIKSDDKYGLQNALRFNGKTCQQTLDDMAEWLGLTANDIEKAISESGRNVDWRPGGGSNNGDQFDDNVKDVADYLLRYSGNPKMSTPKKIRELMNDLEVTDFDLVKKALFYRCGGDFDTFNSAEEVLNRANTEFMNVVKGDTNGDGIVDIIDASLIQKFAVGKIVSFE